MLAEEQQVVTILQNGGINPATFSIGEADATVDNNSEHLVAFHTPGGSAAALLALFPQLNAISGQYETPPTVASANIGGKTVTTVDGGNGNVDYLYPSGDVLWDVNTSDPVSAAAMMAAVQ